MDIGPLLNPLTQKVLDMGVAVQMMLFILRDIKRFNGFQRPLKFFT
jgi:hypothetical protein